MKAFWWIVVAIVVALLIWWWVDEDDTVNQVRSSDNESGAVVDLAAEASIDY